jgi:hypothetical protein
MAAFVTKTFFEILVNYRSSNKEFETSQNFHFFAGQSHSLRNHLGTDYKGATDDMHAESFCTFWVLALTSIFASSSH